MNWKTLGIISFVGSSLILSTYPSTEVRNDQMYQLPEEVLCIVPNGCVFRTLFGEEQSIYFEPKNTPVNIQVAIDGGLEWMIKAQQNNGGWGAGSHSRQDIMDPLAVNTDPATTAMVAMALLRTGIRLQGDEHSKTLENALEYLLMEVENTPKDRLTITDQTGTQIQSKLGVNIDAVLAMQFFTNMLEFLPTGSALQARVLNATNICADKIQQLQSDDGSMKGSGWAGVLQSSMATNALEAAEYYGADIDEEKLEKSREYQKSNYNPQSGAVDTDRGAGVVLYSVSGSVRASAKQARKVREEIRKAKKDGVLAESANISKETLTELGYSDDEAMKLSTSYQVYESSKNVAQEDGVLSGFGNNGGEEFLSFLQTGESLIINDDEGWKKWFDATSSRLLDIQNQDGSWNGHHCITSPVFCTATTLLILSINEDRERLMELGQG